MRRPWRGKPLRAKIEASSTRVMVSSLGVVGGELGGKGPCSYFPVPTPNLLPVV